MPCGKLRCADDGLPPATISPGVAAFWEHEAEAAKLLCAHVEAAIASGEVPNPMLVWFRDHLEHDKRNGNQAEIDKAEALMKVIDGKQ